MTDWTEERVVELKRRRAAGESCSQIAKGLQYVSRNAVIGKLRRLGIEFSAPARPGEARPRPPREPARAPRVGVGRGALNSTPAHVIVAKARQLAPAHASHMHNASDQKVRRAMSLAAARTEARASSSRALPGTEPVTLLALGPLQCKWPINESSPGVEFLFCGAERGEGPYCLAHERLAVSPSTPSAKAFARSLRRVA